MSIFAPGAILFVVGLVATFLGTGVRGRVRGLTTMAAGALWSLAAAGPSGTATRLLVAAAVATLAGMIVFAASLARRVAGAEGRDDSIDEERR